jgi:hypothetical protein
VSSTKSASGAGRSGGRRQSSGSVSFAPVASVATFSPTSTQVKRDRQAATHEAGDSGSRPKRQRKE